MISICVKFVLLARQFYFDSLSNLNTIIGLYIPSIFVSIVSDPTDTCNLPIIYAYYVAYLRDLIMK
jgi:hypothetical protein